VVEAGFVKGGAAELDQSGAAANVGYPRIVEVVG
jgi:hypothetical protein